MMKNKEVSALFRDIADILQIKGDNPFRIRAYEKAAESIDDLADPIERYAQTDTLHQIPGIGEDLANKIKEYLATGKIAALDELKSEIPQGVLELLDIPGVGPKTAKLFYEKLHIKSVSDLISTLKRDALVGIPGIKEKSIENIRKGLEIVKKGRERMLLSYASEIAAEFIAALKKLPAIEKVAIAGSLRRMKESIGDIDILVASSKAQEVMDVFTSVDLVKEVTERGETKATILTKDNIQVDCRVVESKSFGAALVYFTGSKTFNIKLRQMAIKKGFKINEYGVFKGAQNLAGKSESDVFKTLSLSYIEPEMREDTGEIELARKNELPKIITVDDIKGDLHAHSTWSDGKNGIAEMAEAGMKLGYSYLALTDHSQSLKIARGLSLADLRKKRMEIELLNKKLKHFRILFGSEVEIDSSGKLDYNDDILEQFDLVVAAVHSGFKQAKSQLTKRLIQACKNKYVHIIAHPTGRLWGVREPYELDFEEVCKAASDTNTHLEINSFPDRLDLNDVHCRMAKELSVKFAINTDSHSIDQFSVMRFGVAVARRGWLTPKDVVNSLPFEQLLKNLKQ